MPQEMKIIRDMDGVYTNPSAVCTFIKSYVYSKGDLTTNKLSNKFFNMEILEYNRKFYVARTSGTLGIGDVKVEVNRTNSKVYALEIYQDWCKEVEKKGFKPVDVITIYPNCSEATKKFVSEKNLASKQEAEKIVENSTKTLDAPVVPVKKYELSKEVINFVKSIYNEANQAVKESMSPEAFQNSSNPLGMLNLDMIKRGRTILDEIAVQQNRLYSLKQEKRKQETRVAIADLSNRYNMTIPRMLVSGRDDWFLDTGEKLMNQYDLLDTMELLLANAVLNNKTTLDINSMYTALNSDISLVTDKALLKQFEEKMRGEQLDNHHFYTRLVRAFEINQKNAPAFDSSCGNVVSLFHGTRGANLFGILSTHIKLPKNLGPNVVITGAMFGPGIYFGEYSKSLQYSTSRFGGVRNKGNTYYIILCDVALGKMKFEPHARNYAQAPTGYNSVMGVGRDAFVKGCFIKGIGDNKDLKIPRNVFQQSLGTNSSSLLHNEFIVYNQNRFRIRYILEVEAKS